MPRLNAQSRRALTAERRAQILAAAARVFARQGFARATMSAVAREAGIAAGSIYNYFKNKDDLLISIPRTFVQPAVQPLSAEIDLPAVAAHMPPEELLSLLGHNMVSVVQHNRYLLRIFLSSLPSMNKALRAKYYEQVPQYALGQFETYLRQQMDAGVFRGDLDPAIVARLVPGMLLIFVLLQEVIALEGVPRYDYDEVVSTIVQVFLHGMLRVGARSGSNAAPKRPRRARPERVEGSAPSSRG